MCVCVIGPVHVLEQREGKVLSVLMHCLANEPIKVVLYAIGLTLSIGCVTDKSCLPTETVVLSVHSDCEECSWRASV